MANITISDLRPTGAELFTDSESYMNELTNEEITITGGATPGAVGWFVAKAVARYLIGQGVGYLMQPVKVY
jgi:hypothetical protein